MMRSSHKEEAAKAKLRGDCEAVREVTAMPASPSRPLDFQGIGKSTAMSKGGPPPGERRKAGMRMHTGLIAVSFHRLFLGGLLPSRARFRFAGYCHGIRRDWSRQACSDRTCQQIPIRVTTSPPQPRS